MNIVAYGIKRGDNPKWAHLLSHVSPHSCYPPIVINQIRHSSELVCTIGFTLKVPIPFPPLILAWILGLNAYTTCNLIHVIFVDWLSIYRPFHCYLLTDCLGGPIGYSPQVSPNKHAEDDCLVLYSECLLHTICTYIRGVPLAIGPTWIHDNCERWVELKISLTPRVVPKLSPLFHPNSLIFCLQT